MKLLKNIEVQLSIVFISVLLILFAAILMYVFDDYTKAINAVQIRQNVATMGTVVKKYPQLEADIVKNYSRGYQENYEYGRSILKKYSYDENMAVSSNSFIQKDIEQVFGKIIALIAIFAVLLITLVAFCFNRMYIKIRKLSVNAETVIEGEYIPIQGFSKEGDIGYLTFQFNTMTERLGEYVQALSNEKLFLKKAITDISHQLKTPLASLIMFNEIMQNDSNMSEQERINFLSESKNQLDRMEWLIKNMMKMAKLEAGIVEFAKEETWVADTVERSIAPLKLFASEKNIIINISGDTDIKVQHDVGWTTEALSNIIKNCIEHSQSDNEINISWEENNVFVQIVISDNGTGIPRKELPKIFDRFYKGPGSCSPTNIGIGLYITKTILERQGGSIYVSSIEGQGTKFVVRLMKVG